MNINMEKVMKKIDMIRWDSIIKKSTSTKRKNNKSNNG